MWKFEVGNWKFKDGPATSKKPFSMAQYHAKLEKQKRERDQFYEIFRNKQIRQLIFAHQHKILMQHFLRWYEKMPHSDQKKLFPDEESEEDLLDYSDDGL